MQQERVILDQIIPAKMPWSGFVKKGQHLRIIDREGRQAVDFLCYNANDTSERYFAPNTIKAAGTISLTKGHVLYSDQANPLFRIIEDTYGSHDTIGGACSAPSNLMLYGVKDCPGCRESFLKVLSQYGMGHQFLHAGSDRPIGGGRDRPRRFRSWNIRCPAGGDGRSRGDFELSAGQQCLQRLQPDLDSGGRNRAQQRGMNVFDIVMSNPKNLHQPVGPYSQVSRVRASELVFLPGRRRPIFKASSSALAISKRSAGRFSPMSKPRSARSARPGATLFISPTI
jgi:hypothetical protein